ncbi:MAG: MFS transporter [Reyranellaceae bacterium]
MNQPGRWLPLGLVALCFTLGVATRSFNDSFGVFVPQLERAFSAPRASITGIYSVAMIAIGFCGPFIGLVVDRLGPLRLALFGLAAAGGGAVAASQAEALWQLYLGLGVAIGLSGASIGGVFHASILGRWFSMRLGTALAVAWSASGIGQMIMAPLAQALIQARDWRLAYLVLGCGVLAVMVPVLLLPWKRVASGDPAVMALRRPAGTSGPTLSQAVRELPFWALVLSFAMTSVAIFSLAPQIVAYLGSRGLAPAQAANVWAISGLMMPLGMIGFNWLADRGGRVLGAAAAYGCSALGVVALWLVRGPDDWPLLAAFVVLFGSTSGSRGPMITTLATLRYSGAHLGRILGCITIGMGVGAGLGAWIGGKLLDHTGSYGPVMLMSLGALAIAAAALVFEAGNRQRMR